MRSPVDQDEEGDEWEAAGHSGVDGKAGEVPKVVEVDHRPHHCAEKGDSKVERYRPSKESGHQAYEDLVDGVGAGQWVGG